MGRVVRIRFGAVTLPNDVDQCLTIGKFSSRSICSTSRQSGAKWVCSTGWQPMLVSNVFFDDLAHATEVGAGGER